ncbi:hypothetical protein CAPTEDRAFT_146895 [Capitella teleta]|uniref:Uncharacterized protein n=1 Tax=Capitella teleta TaxID=283909 RepID=R7V515_CAPTE|nr:hypothetical protein CAPTEDRAFT_146895 [Capitella teleta]|eukprot:ELU13552.1 hypothetical protein CAPTEDRAFT_146895 [Capitella teleta]
MRLQIRKLRQRNHAAAAAKRPAAFAAPKKNSAKKNKRGSWREHYCFLTAADFPGDRRGDVTLPHVWQGFKEKTTAHGVPHIDQARGVIKRSFWSLITALMISGLAYNLYSISRLYFRYPVDVTIRLLHQSELNFPAVTVCNMSPLKQSAVDASASQAQSLEDASSCASDPTTPPTSPPSTTTCLIFEGLHMIINIDQDDYVKEVGDTAGIRMVAHPQTRMPFPEDEGITVSPGHSTSIGLRQVQIGRKPYPYGNCTLPELKNITRNVYEELYNVQYSSTGCQRTCYQQYVIDKCGCGDPYYPMHGAAFGQTKVSSCQASNITQSDCKYSIEQLFANKRLDCDCPVSCSDTMYSLEVSLGQWPSNVQKDTIFQKLSQKMGNRILSPDYKYEHNLIKLEVYYEEFNFEQISERPSYSAWSYMSDVGGVLGLWIGFSLLTVFEFIELAADIVVWIAAKKCSNAKKTTPVEDIREKKRDLSSDNDAPMDPFCAPYFLSSDPSAPSCPSRTPPPAYFSRPTSATSGSGDNGLHPNSVQIGL